VNGRPLLLIAPSISTDADAEHVTMDPTTALLILELVPQRLDLEEISARITKRSLESIGKRRLSRLRRGLGGSSGRGRRSKRMIGVIRLG